MGGQPMPQEAVTQPIRLQGHGAYAKTRATPGSARKRVAYLINQYPTVSHTFIRREIAAVERCGAVEVVRYSLRRGVHGFVDVADHLEAAKTRVVLDSSKLALAAI